MKKAVFIFLSTLSFCMAYVDNDMDGVEDTHDKCPQTPISDLVNYEGCSLKNSEKKIFYDIIFGSRYSQMNYSSLQNEDTITSYIQADIYFEKWYFQGVASRYGSDTQMGDKKGWDDTLLNLFYKLLANQCLSLNIGGGLMIPTYESGLKNEELDYRAEINLKYNMNENSYLFGSYAYAWINDRDLNLIRYKNTNSFNIGVGYIQNSNASYSIAYGNSDSIYKNIKAIQTLEISYSLDIDSNWFIGVHYDHGLSSSASDNSIGGYIGYYFD